MPERAPGSGLAAETLSNEVAEQAGRSARVIRAGSRLGVWGLVGGIGAMTAFTLGAPVPLAVAMSLMGVGVLVSGLGTLVASAGVLRRRPQAPKLVRAAGLAGAPLGLVLGMLGVTSLTQWPPLVTIVHVLTPVAGILGALVIVLLSVGLVVGAPNVDDDPEP